MTSLKIITFDFITWPGYTPPDSLSSVTRLPASVTQFRYLLLTVYSRLKALCMQPLLPNTNGSLNVRWWFKSKTDGTELCAADASNRSLSLCCTVQLKCDGTVDAREGEVKGKLAKWVGSQYSSHYLGIWCIQHYYSWCAHLGCQ
jgi:hypothetical protein